MERTPKHGRGNIEAIYEVADTWYRGWYFDLRLEEEMLRCQRYGYPVSLLVVKLGADTGTPGTPGRKLFEDDIVALARRRLRRPDLPAVLNESELAICLPHTDRAGAMVVADRVAAALRRYHPVIGIATAVEDARTPGGLYARAAAMAGGESVHRRTA